MNPEDEYEANYEYFPDLIGAYPSAFSIPAIFFVSQFINAIWYSAVSFATAFLNITSKSNHGIPPPIQAHFPYGVFVRSRPVLCRRIWNTPSST